jgi:HEAT repeat protein
MLGGIDQPGVRTFLRDSLTTQRNHASNFAAALAALGRLKDGDLADLAAPKLRDRNWSGLRWSMLDSLGRMGGPKASAVLVEYLRDPSGAQEADALVALDRIDPAAAVTEAQALLRAGHPNPLPEAEAARVRTFLLRGEGAKAGRTEEGGR